MKRQFYFVLVYAIAAAIPLHGEESRAEKVARIRTELAANYFQRGQYNVALEELENALLADSDYAPAYGVRALVYADLKDNKSAEESFVKALHYANADPDINHNFGWFLCLKQNRPADSLKYFETALKNTLYATPAKTQSLGAYCAALAGKLELAEDWIARASRVDPENGDLQLGEAELAYRKGDLISTRRVLAKLASRGQMNSAALWLDVRLENRSGDIAARDKAAETLKNNFADSAEAAMLATGNFE